jgi:3-hydroxy-9,10-secoandrosta-1,3,5(10)-triene-9,17-dione monooxygenase
VNRISSRTHQTLEHFGLTSPSHDIGTELLRRASELVPILRQRARATEQLRRLPDETIADLRRTELLKAARPTRFGGFALDLDQVMAIISELGRGCGSTAWVYGVYCDHNITLGMFPGAMQEDVWAKQPDALISAGLAPGGTIQRTAGGYRLSGRWSYSSGCIHADWAFVQTIFASSTPGKSSAFAAPAAMISR